MYKNYLSCAPSAPYPPPAGAITAGWRPPLADGFCIYYSHTFHGVRTPEGLEIGCQPASAVFRCAYRIPPLMKHAVPFALLAATLAFTGCNTYVGVDNPDQPSSTYSNATGALVTRYKASTETVFNAVKRAVDSQSDTMKRMGESDKRVNNELQEVTVFARAIGDLEIKIEVEKVEDPVTKEVFTQVTVKYGFFGNCEQSQQIVSRITQNLRR